MAVVNPETKDPPFITYLLTPDLCDCFFVIGNRELVEPERIGVVKKMLFAHSVVLRSDWLATEIEKKKDVLVSDMYPETFKNLLRFVYGYDNTANLGFEEADNLLYVAEKYQVEPLKARLSAQLIKLLKPDNICSLLNNPACYRVLELESAIKTILQQETNRVLLSPQFLDLSVDSLVKVMEQTVMNVTEIEVWRAAVLWAKHRTNTDSGERLRQELERPAKHIRICTIDHDSFFKEVVSTGILTDSEVKMACLAKGTGKKQEELVTFSNEVDSRTVCLSKSRKLDFCYLPGGESSNKFDLLLLTKKHSLELLPLKCKGMKCPYLLVPEGETYECKCTIKILQVTDYSNNTSSKDPETIEICQQVEFQKEFLVPFTISQKNVVLEPNRIYRVLLTFNGPVTYFYMTQQITFQNEDLSVKSLELKQCYINNTHQNCYIVPSRSLKYRPLLY